MDDIQIDAKERADRMAAAEAMSVLSSIVIGSGESPVSSRSSKRLASKTRKGATAGSTKQSVSRLKLPISETNPTRSRGRSKRAKTSDETETAVIPRGNTQPERGVKRSPRNAKTKSSKLTSKTLNVYESANIPEPVLTCNTSSVPSVPLTLTLPTLNIRSLNTLPSLKSLTLLEQSGVNAETCLKGQDNKSLPFKKRRLKSNRCDENEDQEEKADEPSNVRGPIPVVEYLSLSPSGVASPGSSSSPVVGQEIEAGQHAQLFGEIQASLTSDEDGDIPLHLAVVHEHLTLVQKFIQLMKIARRGVDRFNKDKQTPLHLAVKLNFLPGVQALLEAGADVNLVDKTGCTSLHLAIKHQFPDCLRLLVALSHATADFNTRNYEGLTPLHTATELRNLDMINYLQEQGADINMMDGKSGRTALFYAAESNQLQLVELLLKHGASPDVVNYAGTTAIMAAQARNLSLVIKVLNRASEQAEDGSSGNSSPAPEVSLHLPEVSRNQLQGIPPDSGSILRQSFISTTATRGSTSPLMGLTTSQTTQGLTTTPAVRGSTTSPAVRGLTTSQTTGGSTTISTVRGLTTSQTTGGSTTISTVRGLTTSQTTGGSTTISAVRGLTTSQTTRGSTTISAVRGLTTSQTTGGSTTISAVRGLTTSQTTGGSTTNSAVRGLTTNQAARATTTSPAGPDALGKDVSTQGIQRAVPGGTTKPLRLSEGQDTTKGGNCGSPASTAPRQLPTSQIQPVRAAAQEVVSNSPSHKATMELFQKMNKMSPDSQQQLLQMILQAKKATMQTGSEVVKAVPSQTTMDSLSLNVESSCKVTSEESSSSSSSGGAAGSEPRRSEAGSVSQEHVEVRKVSSLPRSVVTSDKVGSDGGRRTPVPGSEATSTSLLIGERRTSSDDRVGLKVLTDNGARASPVEAGSIRIIHTDLLPTFHGMRGNAAVGDVSHSKTDGAPRVDPSQPHVVGRVSHVVERLPSQMERIISTGMVVEHPEYGLVFRPFAVDQTPVPPATSAATPTFAAATTVAPSYPGMAAQNQKHKRDGIKKILAKNHKNIEKERTEGEVVSRTESGKSISVRSNASERRMSKSSSEVSMSQSGEENVAHSMHKSSTAKRKVASPKPRSTGIVSKSPDSSKNDRTPVGKTIANSSIAAKLRQRVLNSPLVDITTKSTGTVATLPAMLRQVMVTAPELVPRLPQFGSPSLHTRTTAETSTTNSVSKQVESLPTLKEHLSRPVSYTELVTAKGDENGTGKASEAAIVTE